TKRRKSCSSFLGWYNQIGLELLDGSIHEFTKLFWVLPSSHLVLSSLSQEDSKGWCGFWLCTETLDGRQAGYWELLSPAECLGDLRQILDLLDDFRACGLRHLESLLDHPSVVRKE